MFYNKRDLLRQPHEYKIILTGLILMLTATVTPLAFELQDFFHEDPFRITYSKSESPHC
jgi:hypothetical protein